MNKLGHFPASRRGFSRAHRRFAFVPDAVTLLPPLFSTTRSRAAGWSFWFVCLFSLESESSLLLQTYLQPTTNTRLVSSLTVNDGFLAPTSTTTPSTVKPPQLAPMIVSWCCQENLLSGWRRAHKMPEEDTHCWVNLISCQTINRCVCSCLRMCAYNLFVRALVRVSKLCKSFHWRNSMFVLNNMLNYYIIKYLLLLLDRRVCMKVCGLVRVLCVCG